MEIAIIAPVYNEEKYINDTIKGLKAITYKPDIFIVDDCSTDNTLNILKDIENINVISLKENKGKGNALQKGLETIIDRYDAIGFVDGDVGLTSREMEKLISPILERKADVTIAKFPPPKKKGGFGMVKKLSFYGIKFFTGKEIYSGLSGQRVFKTEVLKDFKTIPFGYGVEVGMTIDILQRGYNVIEIPVEMSHDETGRDIGGIKHRLKQFVHIGIILIRKIFER